MICVATSPFVRIEAVVILAYFASVASVMGYVERTNPEGWAKIGSPSMNPFSGLGNWFPLIAVVFFGFRQGLRSDHMLTVRLCAVRSLFVVAAVLGVASGLFGPTPISLACR